MVAATTRRTRGQRTNVTDEEGERRLREHQKELAARKNKEGLERFAGQKGDQSVGGSVREFKTFESYKRDTQLPERVKELCVHVDTRAASVVVPVMGRPVPFHINTIKNASSYDEGEYAYLRINMLSPGQGVGRKDDQPFEDPSAHFVRNLTFRSKDKNRMAQVAQDITELRKNVTKREQAKKEQEEAVEQDKLIEIRNRRPAKLQEAYLRPPLDGKRAPGEVEIHQNGLRYISPRGEHVKVLYNNIKHFFFQPSVGEMIVLIHAHLKTPIMVGKSKTKDVQFYRETIDMQYDKTMMRGRKSRLGDEDEIEAEQEERKRKVMLDKEFKTYADKVCEAARDYGISLDIPFRELSFQGVPYRSTVLIQPTAEALVQLTEMPFTVITFREIEIVHFERVQFGLKNFDIVFVFKDFNRAPVHINTVPVESLDTIKKSLDSMNVTFSEGPLNLNWGTIMKTITSDPHGFFKDGGWSFLAADSSSEEEEEDDEEESAYELSGSEEESSDDESDLSGSGEATESESGEGSEEDEDDDGEDWDELERKAKKADASGGADDGEKKATKRKR